MNTITKIKRDNVKEVANYLKTVNQHLFCTKSEKSFYKVLSFQDENNETVVWEIDFNGIVTYAVGYNIAYYSKMYENAAKNVLSSIAFPNGASKKTSIKNFKKAKEALKQLEKEVAQLYKDKTEHNKIKMYIANSELLKGIVPETKK